MTKIEYAIQYAVFAHAGTTRKGKKTPYILHPIEAMTIVASLTDDEDVIAAAVLHDVVEDTSIEEKDIRREFGDRVADLVKAESEDKMAHLAADASWEARKLATINHLGELEDDALRICLGDKLANIREMARDHAAIGDELWERFNQKDKGKHKWYYDSVCKKLAGRLGEIPPIAEYRALLKKVFGE